MSPISTSKMSNFRWVICALLFIATTVNYMDRQVLSLTWKDFIAPEFHWTDDHYGTITGLFSIFYAIANLFAGKSESCHYCCVCRSFARHRPDRCQARA